VAAADAVPATHFASDVWPIFRAKCTPCHDRGGGAAAFHTMADMNEYLASQQVFHAVLSPMYCPGAGSKGACAVVRVRSGQMPQGKGCKGDGSDTNPACLTRAEINTLLAWQASKFAP
jgi:hypothetical protein